MSKDFGPPFDYEDPDEEGPDGYESEEEDFDRSPISSEEYQELVLQALDPMREEMSLEARKLADDGLFPDAASAQNWLDDHD